MQLVRQQKRMMMMMIIDCIGAGAQLALPASIRTRYETP
jgi:hypothetical protein